MKILYISRSTFPSKTASSVHVAKMTNAFKRITRSVDVFGYKGYSFSNYKELIAYYDIEEDIDFHLVKRKKGILKFFNYLKISNISRKNAYDAIISRDPLGLFFSDKKSYNILELHDELHGKITRTAFKQMLKKNKIDLIIAITKPLKDYYIRTYAISSNKIIVLPDAANKKKYEYKSKTNDKFAIGYVGSLYPGRGIELILSIAKKMEKHEFYIIGGEKEQVEYFKNISTANVVFTGFLKQGELEKYYKKMDIVLAPYQKEVQVVGGGNTVKYMSPLKIFEYMSFSKPIISSDLPVLHDILIDGYNCLFAVHNSTKDWIEKIEILINDENTKNTIALNAYNDLIDKYTWESRAKKIVEEINKDKG